MGDVGCRDPRQISISNTLADMCVTFSTLISASAQKTPTLVGLKFFTFYFLSLFTCMVFKLRPLLKRMKKKWNPKYYFGTSLVSSGSVWSTVRERSFCRYFNAFSGSDWAFSSNLVNDKKKNKQTTNKKQTTLSKMHCWAAVAICGH